MLKVTDDFNILIDGSAEDLLAQYAILTGYMYRSFLKHEIGEHAKVMLMLTKAQVAGIEAAMKKEDEAENGGN
nr:MAG TPA: hypothetical protein [Caudoviricetes sp.]